MELPTTLATLAQALGLEFEGEADTTIAGLATLAGAGEGDLGFVANPKYRAQMTATRASALIIAPALRDACPCAALIADDPYLAFARATALFRCDPEPPAGIHASAVVSESAILAEGVSVGANAVIAAGVRIGRDSVIGAGVTIGENTVLGERCRIYDNVSIYYGVTMGDDVTLQSGVVIGSDGFGFAPDGERWQRIHQLGGVRIGSRVEIGALSVVDRGALEDTVIGDDVIIDNLCQIAHNVRIGDGTAMAGTAAIAGSATVGKRCTIAGGAGIVGHITVADGTHVGARALVTKSLDGGSWAAGTPLMESREWRKSAVRFSQLDDMARRIAALEKQLAARETGS